MRPPDPADAAAPGVGTEGGAKTTEQAGHSKLTAPLEGGGPCDRCGTRTFRRLPIGTGWRHEDCEPASYRVLKAMRYGTQTGRQLAPRRRPGPAGCRGCCACRGHT